MLRGLVLAALFLVSALPNGASAACGRSGLRTVQDTRDRCTHCRLNNGEPYVVASSSHCEAKCANNADAICNSALYSVHTKQCWLNGVSLEDMSSQDIASDKNFVTFSRCSTKRPGYTFEPSEPKDCLAPRLFLVDSTGDLCKECTLPNGTRRGVTSLAQCEQLCAADAACMSATFWESYRKCWLKDRRLDEMGLSGLVPSDEFAASDRCPNAILPAPLPGCGSLQLQTLKSFQDTCTGCTLPRGTRLNVESLKDCEALCLSDERCNAATFWADQRKCYLKDRRLADMRPSQVMRSSDSFSALSRCPEAHTELLPQPLACRAPFFYSIPNLREFCGNCTLPHGIVLNVPDAIVCEAKCDSTAGCLSAVYESEDRICYLKDRRLQDMRPQDLGTSGPTWTGINMCRESILALPPKDCHWPAFQVLPRIQDSCTECNLQAGVVQDVADIEECQELCSLMPGCQAATFSSNTNRCHMKDRRLDEMEADQVSSADEAFTAVQRCPCPGCAYPDFEGYTNFKSVASRFAAGNVQDLPNVQACLDACVDRPNPCESLTFLSMEAAFALAAEDPTQRQELRTKCQFYKIPVEEQYPRTEVAYKPGWQILSRCQCDAPAREYQPPVLRCKRVRSAAESDRLAVQPTYIAFNAVNVHTTSPVLSFHVRASPTSQTDDKHEPIVSARCRNINPSFDSNLSPFMLGLDTTACGADGVAFPLVLPLPGDLPVSFRPEAKGVYTAHIELLAEDESVLATVTVVGIGGEAFVGEHFSHPVMEADPVYIALPGEATAQVLMQGRGSHTHERRSLMDYLWTHLNTGATTIEMDFQCRHELGVHGYHLTVTDNHRAHESDVISFEVAPADRVPGTLMRMYNSKADLPDGQAVWSSLQTTSFAASPGHFGDSTGTVISFAGTFDWPGGSQVLTWEGCEDGSVQVLFDKVAVEGDGLGHVNVIGPAEERELHFSCLHKPASTVEVLLNGETIPHPYMSVLDLRPTLNKRVSSEITRPGEVGTVSGFYLGDAIVKLAKGDIVLEPKIHGRTERGIRFDYPPGELAPDGEWSIYALRDDLESNRVTVNIQANAPLTPTFTQHKLTPTVPQSAATVWCHGKLYVANVWDGFIYEYTLNDNNEVSDWQTDVKLVTSIPHLLEPGGKGEAPGLSATILGMTCDPWEPDSDFRVYFTRNQLFRNEVESIEQDVNGGGNWTEWKIPEKVWYTSKISYTEPLKSNCVGVTNFFYDENPSVCTLAPIHDLLVGLPCSNYDHAQNCLAFTHDRKLLLCSGSSTNAGIPNPSLKSLTESPLSGAILAIDLFEPGFRKKGQPHRLEYEWLENVPDAIRSHQSPDDMRFGMHVRVKPASTRYVKPRVSGCRNPFGLTVTTAGNLHITISGPNSGFGPKLAGVTEDGEPLGMDDDFGERLDPVAMNIPPEGCFMGHANIARCNAGRAAGLAQADILDCTWRSWLANHPGYCAAANATSHVFELESALGGIMQYKSRVFGGTVDDALYIPSYRGWTWRCPAHVTHGTDCVPDTGQGADDLRDRNYPASPGLAIQHIPGGAHVITEYFRDSVFVNTPDYAAAAPEAWTVHPDRAPLTAAGRFRFVISGARLRELSDVAVFFGRQRAAADTLNINAEGTRIHGILPDGEAVGLVDVVVKHKSGEMTLPSYFFYLLDDPKAAA